MPSIVGKKHGNQTYYYLVESARVDGKPRIVAQQYLGSAEEVVARLSGAPAGAPERTQHKKFGDVAAVWGMLKRMQVVEAIDEVCGSRRSDAAASVGTYVALATMNRIVAPCSKLAFADWWATTAGPRFTRLPVAAMDHRRIWDALDTFDTAKLAAAERAISTAMVTEFGLDLSGLALDMTNFATFIDSANDRAPLAQRGHAKQKRHDLRLVGLALVVTRDGAIPITSHTYPGNRPDVTQFADVLDELTSRYRSLFSGPGGGAGADGPGQAPTVVFDAGQNSARNFAHLRRGGLHYVGSLPPGDFPGLLGLPAARFNPVDPERFPGLTAYDTRAPVFGTEQRVIVTHSVTLHAAQSRGFDQTLDKATRALALLAAALARGRTRRGRRAVLAEVTRITSARWVKRVLGAELNGEAPAEMRLTWRIDPAARRDLEDEVFGKRLLVTDQDHWTVADVVAGYRSQNDVESGFRQLKDPHVVGFSPMFHWTESKIRIHVFTCVLALAVAHLMRREAHHAGLDLSVRELLLALAGIEETVLLYPTGNKGRPRAQRILTDTDATQKRLFDLFHLSTYAPRR
ncbi:MAG: IS1634 family transposase [Actinobacteria bacterium]|nr:IS1634 family transposase [Actinomycetota bacterium]